jgi:hypothetical protein
MHTRASFETNALWTSAQLWWRAIDSNTIVQHCEWVVEPLIEFWTCWSLTQPWIWSNVQLECCFALLDRLHAGKWASHNFKQTKFYTHYCEMCKELRVDCVRGKDGALILASYKMSFAIYSKLLDYWNWKYEQNSIYNSLIEFFWSTSIYLCHCLRRTGGEPLTQFRSHDCLL